MHAHSGKKGCFIFGNSYDFKNAVNSHLFVRLIALNSADFDHESCNFSEKNMYKADKSDGLSKEGSGRVSFYKKYKIYHSYTIECNYTTGRHKNTIYQFSSPPKDKFCSKKF